MAVRFTREALLHIEGIHFYIAIRSPRAAARIVERIFADTDRLTQFPRLGHAGIVPGTFEWTVRGFPYVIVHEFITDGDIIVLGVFHGSQER